MRTLGWGRLWKTSPAGGLAQISSAIKIPILGSARLASRGPKPISGLKALALAIFSCSGVHFAKPKGPEHGYRYVRSARKEHWLFGWLQVAEVVELGEDGSWLLKERPELAQHPHCRPGWGAHNTLYVATNKIRLGGRTLNIPGAGVFPEAKEMLRLTVPGENSSLWRVPSWLNRQVGLSYHRDPARWGRGTLQVVARGQEFVADIDDNPDALAWLEELFQNTNRGCVRISLQE